MKTGKTYAKAGEICYCTNGHPVFILTKDIKFGQSDWPVDAIAFFTGHKKPKLGTPYEECLCWCGAEYVALYTFHFKEGWR